MGSEVVKYSITLEKIHRYVEETREREWYLILCRLYGFLPDCPTTEALLADLLCNMTENESKELESVVRKDDEMHLEQRVKDMAKFITQKISENEKPVGEE